jgi:hypothetical protein
VRDVAALMAYDGQRVQVTLRIHHGASSSCWECTLKGGRMLAAPSSAFEDKDNVDAKGRSQEQTPTRHTVRHSIQAVAQVFKHCCRSHLNYTWLRQA